MKIYNMGKIHILVGRGKNCTCYDCSVLYGGDCYTTDENNLLDALDAYINSSLKEYKDISMTKLDKIIFGMMPQVKKYFKINTNQFYKVYYSFMPLVYFCSSKIKDMPLAKNANRFNTNYKSYRGMLFSSIKDDIEKIKHES